MPTSLTRTINAVLLAILILIPLPALSETVAIPIFLTYPQLRFLAVREMFKGPDNTARYGLDDTGCAFVTYSEPHLSAEGQLLRVEVATLATIGINTTDGCATIGHWKGRTVVKGKPVLLDGQPLSAEFRLQTAELYDQQGHRLSGTPVLQASEERLHQALSKLRIDLSPEVDRLKEWLPSVLPRYSADRLTGMVDSLRIGHILVRPDGLDVRLTIDVDKMPQAGPEPALNAAEMEQLEQTYRTWDAFLTFVVKQAAAATQSEALRSALLEILLDARYEMKAVLVADADSGTDPVKKLFVRSWERLEPVMLEISVQAPEQNPVPFLSFMTAADALMALDRLRPRGRIGHIYRRPETSGPIAERQSEPRSAAIYRRNRSGTSKPFRFRNSRRNRSAEKISGFQSAIGPVGLCGNFERSTESLGTERRRTGALYASGSPSLAGGG